MQTIRRGARNPVALVKTWQEFLRGLDLYLGEVDGKFGPLCEAATERYQELKRLRPVDGIVGNGTWGQAMVDGLEMVESTTKGIESPNWPPTPDDLKPASLALRHKLYGKFSYKPAPHKHNPEAIRITDGWQKDNIVRFVVPELKGVRGASKSGTVYWHKAAKAQLQALFKVWARAGLLHLVKGWAGSFVPRFVRGSRSSLSNHAWGTAFDINVPWNGLGRRPALVGEQGEVRSLVKLANLLGFWWGGHYARRKDGMHFECAKVMTQDEIDEVLAWSDEELRDYALAA